MATPRVSETPATQRNYLAQLTISAALAQAVREMWGIVSPLSSADAMQAFRGGTVAVVDHFAQAAVVTASDHYRAARLDAGVRGDVRLPPINSPDPAKVAKELDWIERRRLDVEAEQAAFMAEVEATILGEAVEALEKVVADEARAFTVAAVEGDEQALGFRRVPRPDACAWCLALATRKTRREGLAKDFGRYGAGGLGGDEHIGVYKSREAAGQLPPNTAGEVNRYHFNCHCTVEPVFATSAEVPVWLQDIGALYGQTDDFNHFRRVIEARRRGEAPDDPTPAILPIAARPDSTAALADLLGRIDVSMRVA